jgi:hypothetical protein
MACGAPAIRRREPVSKRETDPFGIDNDYEAFRLLDLIDAEFRSDPQSVQCFDLRIVERVRRCVETRKALERKGVVPPLLTAEPPSGGGSQ